MDKLRSKKSPVLFVTPHTEDANRISQMLRPLPLVVDHVVDLQHARVKYHRDRYRVILTEASLPDGNWRDLLSLSREQWPAADVIVTDPHADARFWAEALNLGAYDLLVQPFRESEVRRILSHVCARSEPQMTASSALS
jgi:DNA-binding NtrC family response regulator